ncbi:unnamed protein product [Dovyalis caffra]|uniref:Uncharacterized protein n=1 Tax=Dovyalis caffra TaxID=77055 RepID=A0AAV1QTN2_9ROSI|nr:unnamed protein product [Dovyalis caffra]
MWDLTTKKLRCQDCLVMEQYVTDDMDEELRAEMGTDSLKHPGSLLEGFAKTQVSALAVKENFLVAGEFQGELIRKVLFFLEEAKEIHKRKQ